MDEIDELPPMARPGVDRRACGWCQFQGRTSLINGAYRRTGRYARPDRFPGLKACFPPRGGGAESAALGPSTPSFTDKRHLFGQAVMERTRHRLRQARRWVHGNDDQV